MPKKTTTTAAPAVPPVSFESFDPARATRVSAYRAEDAARKMTVAWHQASADSGKVHRFTVTGLYIDTIESKAAAKMTAQAATTTNA
jgi:hypothetical protein